MTQPNSPQTNFAVARSERGGGGRGRSLLEQPAGKVVVMVVVLVVVASWQGGNKYFSKWNFFIV